MNMDQRKEAAAEPAEQDLKKHGDAMKQQVKDAAAKQPPQRKDDDKGKDALDALNP